MFNDFTIRQATAGDAAIIARHRVAMMLEISSLTPEIADQLFEASTAAIGDALRDGTYVGWLAMSPIGEVLAGAGVHVKPQLPRMSHGRVVTNPIPLVVNVYTEPAWRRKNIARTLMLALMRWAEDNGFDRVLLHASEAGRPLYTSLGFAATNEMRWIPGETELAAT